MTPFIETFTGTRFQPLAPTTESIRIEDVAHALSQQNRFAGHTRVPYSVAEHCVRVSWLLEEQGHGPEIQHRGTLHDASETWLQDVPAPLKHSPDQPESFEAALMWALECYCRGEVDRAIQYAFAASYCLAEKRIMALVCEKFGMPEEEPAEVRTADQIMLATEARDLMPNRPEHWRGLLVRPHHEVIVPWSAREAEQHFMERFRDLDGRR